MNSILERRRTSRTAVLLVLCAATLAISLATTAINVALPSLALDFQANNRELQWIVDAYNLLFATFVLAFGSLSDRYGRKGALLLGLTIFGGGAVGASFAESSGQLIVWQAVMGLGAAFVYPTTLSILSNVFTERAEKAKAIGIWGATTGVGVACGPILGGWLLEHFWWGSVFLALATGAAIAIIVSAGVVTTSRDPSTPRIDVGGLILSVLAVGFLVYTVIEAPEHGWASAATLGGFVGAAALLFALVMWERKQIDPMIDVRLFTNMRFTAASASVTFAYFALFGFIFLISQYFQLVREFSPFETGLKFIPVAASIAVGSVLGTMLAVKLGNKLIVTLGLVLFTTAFLWISTLSQSTSYAEIALQMIPLGLGLGLTSAPATEAIMGAVPLEKAGIGSGMNDATREVGGTLGVAIIGSVYASLYASSLAASDSAQALPEGVKSVAGESIGAAAIASDQLRGGGDQIAAEAVSNAANSAFLDGLAAGSYFAAGVTALGAIVAAFFLPSRPKQELTVHHADAPAATIAADGAADRASNSKNTTPVR
ncbi:MFS transporter [Rhodococcus opacus]|uniref:MFS transporter n=1 Tax=Rhodococcus opacus TaxID=37919 RepID=UPI0002A2FF4E|nr:MFS transporter [Rhodococcus opacus]ELB92255.1 Permease, MFS superfamily protein [Rhodococcus wratislaviensis IFP 2016]MBA8964532.1 EmrB/QacA subfamily drug resistance transporter [Rhodococcus opacus]MBP2207506.1 EmrB/QacA subfamily drug resistance transporter [Rhodococcus opacus]MDX5965477.1 MFS transporter [Rhodococcus opacus]